MSYLLSLSPLLCLFQVADTALVTFRNGTRFRWSIINDAQAKVNFTRVGVADNSFVAFWLYKDTGAELYEIDGWKCQAIYWGF